MSKVIGEKELSEILANRSTRTLKPTVFGKEIEALSKNSGLMISKEEWKMKTSPSSYYYRKYNGKKGDVKISCLKMEDGYLIIRK